MLERRTATNGVVYYASALLSAIGVRHAFSTRIGGISPRPFDALNLGNPNGCEIQDDYDRIWENYRLLLTAIDCNNAPPLRVHQVHGNALVRAEKGREFDTSAKADVIVSDDADRPISIRVADCVPVLISTSDGKRVAAVHAGWRGIIAGAAPAAAKALIESSPDESGPASLLAAIGPCIGESAFEVGPEVLAEFERDFGSRAPIRRCDNGKGFVDLREAIRIQLLDTGLMEQSIDQTDRCTFTHKEEFYSHRRDNGVTGRMAAVICPAA